VQGIPVDTTGVGLKWLVPVYGRKMGRLMGRSINPAYRKVSFERIISSVENGKNPERKQIPFINPRVPQGTNQKSVIRVSCLFRKMTCLFPTDPFN